MSGRRSALGLAGLLLLSLLAALAAPLDATVQPPDEAPPLTLDDLAALDALLEADAEEAESPALDRQTLLDIGALVAVLGFALVSFFRKSEPLKIASLVLSVAYLGFYKASLVSIVDIFGALQLSLPTFSTAIPYYVLIAFTIVSTLLFGRLYCGRICAFGALTQLMDRIVPSRFRVELPPAVDRWAVYAKYVILFGAIAYVLGGGSTLVYPYIEPFWMFTRSGTTVMWTLLGVLLLATVFVRNLYCRYLCSVGAGLGLLSTFIAFPIQRWSECQTCKLCEKVCEWGAIQGPTIVRSECVRCDDCERLYADEARCPHWLILARSKKRIPVSSV